MPQPALLSTSWWARPGLGLGMAKTASWPCHRGQHVPKQCKTSLREAAGGEFQKAKRGSQAPKQPPSRSVPLLAPQTHRPATSCPLLTPLPSQHPPSSLLFQLNQAPACWRESKGRRARSLPSLPWPAALRACAGAGGSPARRGTAAEC